MTGISQASDRGGLVVCQRLATWRASVPRQPPTIDGKFPIVRHLMDVLSYPIIEGSNVGVRRRHSQALFRTPGYDPLAASGMA